jgi:hypothetical protein
MFGVSTDGIDPSDAEQVQGFIAGRENLVDQLPTCVTARETGDWLRCFMMVPCGRRGRRGASPGARAAG